MNKIIGMLFMVCAIGTMCLAGDELKCFDGVFKDISGKDLTIYDVMNGRAYIGINTNGEFCVSEYKTWSWNEWKKVMDDFKPCAKSQSDLYQCAGNDFIYPSDTNKTYEIRLRTANDLVSARMSDIRQVTQKIGGEIRVYFEICGNGYSLAEKHVIEKEIQEAITKILKQHYEN
jgi:pyruvate carboxylase